MGNWILATYKKIRDTSAPRNLRELQGKIRTNLRRQWPTSVKIEDVELYEIFISPKLYHQVTLPPILHCFQEDYVSENFNYMNAV